MPARKRPPIVHPKPGESTIKELYVTAWRCGHPDCLKPLYRVSDTGETILNIVSRSWNSTVDIRP